MSSSKLCICCIRGRTYIHDHFAYICPAAAGPLLRIACHAWHTRCAEKLKVWNRLCLLGSLWQHRSWYFKRNGVSSWGQFDQDHGSSTNRPTNYYSLQKLTIKVKNKKTRYMLQSHSMISLRKCIRLVDANLQYTFFTQVVKWEVHTEQFLATGNAVVLFDR